MANLWESVFIPGTTPVLVIATNVSFLLLQITLIALLVFTGSIHFIVLNFLCAGLWGAINWFIKEVEEVQRVEKAKELAEGQRKRVEGEIAAEESKKLI